MDVRGASAEALAALTDELAAAAGSGETAASVATGLFNVSQTLRTEPALRRFAADASVAAESKHAVVKDVFGGKIADDALTLLLSAVSRRWTQGHDLVDALEHLSEIAVVRSADDADRLVDELFSVEQAIQTTPELRDALADPARSTADKESLIDSLLGATALPATVTLVKQALAGTYRTVTAALEEYQKVATSVRNEGVATVRVAAPLSPEQETRLAAALAKQYGREIHLNTLVDPTVIGGIKVEIGDDVIDGSIASKLDDAQRALAG
ncbi:F0F1 ATP synthase subunit delta [Nocardioides sp. Kera G14]|uniref:F0F1 ATP synthase subunit delta n=1 Tax=Nocardioides sp. Kera G14 TaxID=2884264 RepID=UPI001D0F6A9B|nr:F0F1 ATP synthase subunit delta [Nocardioides sp. Kera G14]UDY24729.1 F0F1 ATP synthase subunit delta [Nocardioides sp. Kera G14]